MAKGKSKEPEKVVVQSNKSGKKIVDSKTALQNLSMRYAESRFVRQNAISSACKS